MADVKIGLNQTGKPAPIGYRRFENAWTLIFAPSIAGYGATLGMTPHAAAIFGATIILVTAAVKGFGMILGNGQTYQPTNETVDNAAK